MTMLEELCRTSFYNACHEIVQNERLVMLKGTRPFPPREFADFFVAGHKFNWEYLPVEMMTRQRPGSIKLKAWHWINENADRIVAGYVLKRLGGNLEKAMRAAGTFSALFEDFRAYYENRRMEYMPQNGIKALNEFNTELVKKKRTPQSHGGVANLLKVLTKTMHEQGSSIVTIAKVQYAVCLQAGICIPEEFLTDVLVGEAIAEVEAADDGK